jgi:hypothetical protein
MPSMSENLDYFASLTRAQSLVNGYGLAQVVDEALFSIGDAVNKKSYPGANSGRPSRVEVLQARYAELLGQIDSA